MEKKSTYTTLYVGGLLYSRTDKEIKELFSEFGKVNSVKIITDVNDTNKKKGYAFVQMAKNVDALKAIKELNMHRVDGRMMKVSIASSRDQKIQQEMNEELSKKPSPATAKGQRDAKPKTKRAMEEKKEKAPFKKPNGLSVLFDYLGSKK
jgi:RNA recognition motif-containing protein